MSRIGKRIIEVPEGVTVTLENNEVVVKGPKGILKQVMLKDITMKQENNEITLNRNCESAKAMHGTMNALITNMIKGVTAGYEKVLEIIGVGYRFNVQGKKLVINAGYSHPVELAAPAGITFDVPNANEIIVKGMDKELVGQTAAVIRTKRPPEVYRGKGIKYAEEVIRRKEGKAGKK